MVEKLGQALRLSESVGRGLQFVTLAGERIAPDGSVVVGPAHAATGLISRTQRAAPVESANLGFGWRAEGDATGAGESPEQIDQDRANRDRAESEHERLGGELAEHQAQLGAAEQRLSQLEEQIQILESQRDEAEKQLADADRSIEETKNQLQVDRVSSRRDRGRNSRRRTSD